MVFAFGDEIIFELFESFDLRGRLGFLAICSLVCRSFCFLVYSALRAVLVVRCCLYWLLSVARILFILDVILWFISLAATHHGGHCHSLIYKIFNNVHFFDVKFVLDIVANLRVNELLLLLTIDVSTPRRFRVSFFRTFSLACT